MTTSANPYRGFRFPAEVIEHAVWLYHCFSLGSRHKAEAGFTLSGTDQELRPVKSRASAPV